MFMDLRVGLVILIAKKGSPAMRFKYFTLVALVAVSGSCSKSKSKTSSDTTTVSSETIASVAETLNMAYPGSLSISVFPTSDSSSLRLADEEDEAPESLKAKEEEAKPYLEGKAEHCLPPSLFRPAKKIEESCYEFDQDMISGVKDGHENGTANGKSTISGSSEACLVSFARAQVKAIEEIIDQGLGLQQAMICQAAKDGIDPADAVTAEGVDLADNLEEAAVKAVDERAPTIKVSEASMLKDEDGVYRVSIAVTITKDGKDTTQTYKLAHVPDADDNSVYHGVMSITREEPANPGNPVIGKRYISVNYTRALDDAGKARLKTELRSARMADSLEAEAFNEDGTLDFNAGTAEDGSYTGFTESNKAVSSQIFVAFDLDAEDNTGGFEYWQNPGSDYSEPARGMIFSLNQNADTGRLEGCGVSGAALGSPAAMGSAMSIRKAVKTGATLAPTGSYHPFFNLDGGGSCTGSDCTKTVTTPHALTATWSLPAFSVSDNLTAAATWAKNQVTAFVTRQCVAQDADGVYVIDTAEIPDTVGYSLFNPTNASDLVIGPPDRPKGPPPAPKDPN